MTLETCDWLEYETLLHVVNTVHMVLIWVLFFPPSSWSTGSDIQPHTCRYSQTNVEKYARGKCARTYWYMQ